VEEESEMRRRKKHKNVNNKTLKLLFIERGIPVGREVSNRRSK